MRLDAATRQEFAELGVTFTGRETEGDQDDAFAIWDVNRTSLEAFLDCETQWRFIVGPGGAIRVGLDYAGVDVLLRRRDANDFVFEDIRVMERASLAAFDELAEAY